MNGPSATARPRWGEVWAPLLIAGAGLAAYANSFSGPLVFDDIASIADNPTLRHWSRVLTPPLASTTSGRPFLNLSLAVNTAISGTEVWSYHALNLAIHLLAGLVLFGVIRRTLAARVGVAADALACAVSLLWVLHPLQTEAVTYVVQRAESLMGLCYLLTLYCFIRATAASRHPRTWFALSFAACLLGMATKEVMVSAPLVVLLYDRTFLAGSFGEAWRRHWRVYAGLAATWLLLLWLVFSARGRNGTAGFGGEIPWWSYALTQLPAIAHYLRLCLWPFPLVFYYGRTVTADLLQVWPAALLVAGLAAATGWALVRRPAAGFLGAAFFLILAPSSSVVPVATETMAEHRMYLPLIPVTVLTVLGLNRWLPRATGPICLVLAAILFALTWHRNETYHSALGLWADTVAYLPANPWVRNEYGTELARRPERSAEAIGQFEEALRLKPDYVDAHNNLGNVLLRLSGRTADAAAQYEEALRLKPDNAVLHDNLGNALLRLPGRANDGIAQYEEALHLKPDDPEAHFQLGNAWSNLPGKLDDAVAQYEEALRRKPDYITAHNNLGNLLLRLPGRLNDAIAQYEEALRLRPDYAEAHYNLGTALRLIPGRTDEAIAHFEAVVRLKPDYAQAHYNLAVLLLRVPGRGDDARAQLAAFLQLWPDKAEARRMVAGISASPP